MAAQINREYKDRLFRLLFGNEKYKENTLALYNALNGTSYTNVDDVTIYTIDDVIYIDMKNDVAFILDSELSLWEQQSTYNPNMHCGELCILANYTISMQQKHIEIYIVRNW